MVQEQTLQGGVTISAGDTISNQLELYFDIIKEHSISVQNQITDNYLENNTAVQDHIAHSPITVTVSGLIGELIYKPAPKSYIEEKSTPYLQNGWNKATGLIKNEKIRATTNKLGELTVLLPPVSNAMQVARNASSYIEASVNRYIQMFVPTEDRLRLEQVYSNLLILRNNNKAFRVQTPFKELDSMYIQSITLRQGNENYVGDISITLKQLRFVGVETTKANKDVMAKYNEWARAQEENNGKAQGENSALYNLLTPNTAYVNRK